MNQISQPMFCVAVAILIATSPLSAQESAPAQTKSSLGLAPPAGATILFDGSNFDAWKPLSWQWINPKNDQKEIQWKLIEDNAFEIDPAFEGKQRKQYLTTKQRFGSYRLHLEFQLPEEGSGNSGVFFGPMYELQIIDSTSKQKLGKGDCGAIYEIRTPDVNAGKGPGVWQTVDLEFQPAVYQKNGFLNGQDYAKVTVRLNDQLIHENYQLNLRRNKYAAFPEEPLSPIILQEHGAPVKFRNIWLVERDKNPE